MFSLLLLILLLSSVDSFILYTSDASSSGSSDDPTWISEELWPKEKSLIHIKLIKPIRREILIKNERQIDYYYNSIELKFDSSFKSLSLNGCLIQFKSDENGLSNEFVERDSNQIQLEISGTKCFQLPLRSLTKYAINVTQLVIRSTSVRTLTRFMFAASKFDKLQRIHLINNSQLSEISARSFDGLTRLTYISFLDNGQLSNLSVEAFTGCKQLEELIFVNNGRNAIRSVIKSSSSTILPNLIHLHIDCGQLGDHDEHAEMKILKDDFRGLNQIKYFQLTSCAIKAISSDSFASMSSNLNSLNLSNNTKLINHSKFIQQLTKSKLIHLDLSRNKLMKLKETLIAISKTNIKHLYLNDANLVKLSDIPPMPNIIQLHLDSNRIQLIEDDLDSLENLKFLSLKRNQIKRLNINQLESLNQLNYLDLSGNERIELSEKFFIYSTSLVELNLNAVKLGTLKRNQFLGLFKLRRLRLRSCSIESIEYLTFFPLKSLELIDLSDNPQLIDYIRENNEQVFIGLEPIKMLLLASDRIRSDDVPLIMNRINENLHSIDLSDNLITFLSSTTLQNFTQLKYINLNNNRIQSWSSYRIFNHNPLIETLLIANNSLTTITNEMLGDFRKLKNLTFAFNPLRCNCEWNGPLLLLHHQQKHRNYDNQLEILAHKQQQIVSTSFSNEALPKSLLEWLNMTKIQFIDSHPLRSKSQYKCFNQQQQIVLKHFFSTQCEQQQKFRKINLTLLSIVASSLLLLTVFMLIIAYVYHSTIGSIFSMVDDDFLHDYEYDAFVSYNVTDSDWVFKQLIPNLETSTHYATTNANNFNEQQQQTTAMLNNNSSSDHQQHSHLSSSTNQIKLCVYDRDFVAGRAISECVTESIRSSRKVILVISNNFASSPWCRFETDLAHNTLMDQNREGLILIKLEEICYEKLEKIAPQLHFLLKTRIYLQWNENDRKEQQVFWKKLRNALGFTTTSTSNAYSTVKHLYYKQFKTSQCNNSKKHLKDRRHSLVLLPSKNQKQESIQLQELKEIIVNKCSKDATTTTTTSSSPSSCSSCSPAASNQMMITTTSSASAAVNNYTMNQMKDDI